MKWFKHISDSLDDPFIFDLIDKFGGDGYLVFFGTLEIMSREFNIKSPGICSISHKFLTKKLQLSRQKVVKILEYCHKKERIFITYQKSSIQLNCPKLKDLCDQWTQRQLSSLSVVTTAQEAEVEEEVEKEKNNRCPFQKIISLYHSTLPELPKLVKLTNNRKAVIKARWNEKDQNELSFWMNFFQQVKETPFLLGKNDRDWKADLMWLCKEENMAKVIEGKYRNNHVSDKNLIPDGLTCSDCKNFKRCKTAIPTGKTCPITYEGKNYFERSA